LLDGEEKYQKQLLKLTEEIENCLHEKPMLSSLSALAAAVSHVLFSASPSKAERDHNYIYFFKEVQRRLEVADEAARDRAKN